MRLLALVMDYDTWHQDTVHCYLSHNMMGAQAYFWRRCYMSFNISSVWNLHGALLLDSRANPVAERPLGIEMSRYLLDHEIREHCSSCALFAGSAMYVLEETGPWLNPVYTPSTLAVQKARDIDFLQISFGFRERTRSMAWGERLQADVAGKAQVQCSLSVADVTARGVGKATGIAWALDALCLSPGNILTVGDDGNDREMLAAYDGYAMEGADRDVLAAAGKSTASIADLVEQCL